MFSERNATTTRTGGDEQKEQGTRGTTQEEVSLSQRLLKCCKSQCFVPLHSVLLYAIIQSTLLPKVASRSFQGQGHVAASVKADCSSVCDILHSNSTLSSSRLRGNDINDNYQRCLVVCCMEEEIQQLLGLQNGGQNGLDTKMGTFDKNMMQNGNKYFTQLPPFTTKGETPSMTRQNGNTKYSGFPSFLSSATKRSTYGQNERKIFPFAYSNKCNRYVSVQYEHQVDKMRVLTPQKRRWGSTIGSCIKAHCGGVGGPNRVDCIMRNCHRTRRSDSRYVSKGSKSSKHAWGKNIDRLLQA